MLGKDVSAWKLTLVGYWFQEWKQKQDSLLPFRNNKKEAFPANLLLRQGNRPWNSQKELHNSGVMVRIEYQWRVTSFLIWFWNITEKIQTYWTVTEACIPHHRSWQYFVLGTITEGWLSPIKYNFSSHTPLPCWQALLPFWQENYIFLTLSTTFRHEDGILWLKEAYHCVHCPQPWGHWAH